MRDIAIIGIAGRFPGAKNVSEFWSNLCAGRESIRTYSDDELRKLGISEEVLADPNYVKAAPVLENIDLFDAGLFSFSRREAEFLDPQQRFLLECAHEAIEGAGYRPGEIDRSVGVFVGSGGMVTSYLLNCLESYPELRGATGSYQHLGNDKDFVPTRISYKLNLNGPSIAVQTACSTSLVATHLACQSILNGECDMALAGGASIRIPHHTGYIRQDGDIFSVDGHCRTFDASATGTLFGSGVGLVLLKNLEDALNDGDIIYAVIRGSAINNDGSTKVSYTASSAGGQTRCMSEALAVADVNAETIQYVEAHGTATIMGDPVEVSALTQAFRIHTKQKGYCGIGSVKTNVGHLDAASGITSLIKVALSLHNKKIPASINFNAPNPKINFKESPFFVNTELKEWPSNGHPRRACVNSLGIGGTNAFMVLEEAPQQPPKTSDAPQERPMHILTLSGRSKEAVNDWIAKFSEYFATETPDVGDLCATVNLGRQQFEHRIAIVSSSTQEFREKFGQLNSGKEPAGVQRGATSEESIGKQLAMLFSGQGSQYVGMGRKLYESQPTFRKELDLCAKILSEYLDKPLLNVMFENGDSLNQTAYTQPALFALEYSLYRLWNSWGIEPAAVAGHSVGELVGACVAGVFSLRDGLKLIAARGRLMQGLKGDCTMASIQASEARVRKSIEPVSAMVSIAAINGPASTVISGDRKAIQAVLRQFEAENTKVKELTVSHGFHSPQMDPILDEFEKVASSIKYSKPKIRLISNLSGKAVEKAEVCEPKYWRTHLREAVRFEEGIKSLVDMGCKHFLEIGPGTTLMGMGKQCHENADDMSWLPSLKRDRGDWEQILDALGSLYVQGAPVNWAAFDADYPRRQKVIAPTYPFQRQRYWIEGRSQEKQRSIHPLLGRHIEVSN